MSDPEPDLHGLQRVLRYFGEAKLNGRTWRWDYAAGCAVADADLPVGSDRWLASERARFQAMADAIRGPLQPQRAYDVEGNSRWKP